jgi:hypothetical protein
LISTRPVLSALQSRDEPVECAGSRSSGSALLSNVAAL